METQNVKKKHLLRRNAQGKCVFYEMSYDASAPSEGNTHFPWFMDKKRKQSQAITLFRDKHDGNLTWQHKTDKQITKKKKQIQSQRMQTWV